MWVHAEAVLTSTHNVCFGSKLRILDIPLQTPFSLAYIKVGFKGVYISRTCFPDDYVFSMTLNDIYNKVEDKIGGVFESYGRFVANHAVKVLVVAIVVNIALGVGLMRLEKVKKSDEVYFPMGKFLVQRVTLLHYITKKRFNIFLTFAQNIDCGYTLDKIYIVGTR